MSWEALTALSTLAATVIVAGAAVLAVRQLSEMRKAGTAQSVLRAFDEIASSRAARMTIYGHSPLDNGEMPSAQLVLAMDEAFGPLDRLVVLTDLGLLPETVVMELYGELVIRLWTAGEDLVMAERARRGDHYRRRSEQLYERAVAAFEGVELPEPYPPGS